MQSLLTEIRKCTICAQHLKDGPNPILSAHPKSKIVIIGQAPGRIVHNTGVPWDDKSGDNLRNWLNVDKPTFYDETVFAIVPMGFCYPGHGKSGDLPPRPECAPQWHEKVLDQLNDVRLIVLIGQYAQKYYLQKQAKPTLTETVKNYHTYLPKYFVLPHPSPRNNIWRRRNPWFDSVVIPEFRRQVDHIIRSEQKY